MAMNDLNILRNMRQNFNSILLKYLSEDTVGKLERYYDLINSTFYRELMHGSFFELSIPGIKRLLSIVQQSPYLFTNPEDGKIAELILFLYSCPIAKGYFLNSPSVKPSLLKLHNLINHTDDHDLPAVRFHSSAGSSNNSSNKKMPVYKPSQPQSVIVRSSGIIKPIEARRPSIKQPDRSYADAYERKKAYQIKPHPVSYDLKHSFPIIKKKSHSAGNSFPPVPEVLPKEEDPSERLFREILSRAPGLSEFIRQVRTLPPVKRGEKNDLISAIQSGDRKAYERLTEIHIKTALRTALKVSIKYSSDLEETVGCALEALAEYFRNFNGTKEDLNWLFMHLFRMTENKIIPEWMFFPSESLAERKRAAAIRNCLDCHGLTAVQARLLSDEEINSILPAGNSKDSLLQEAKNIYIQDVDSLDSFVSRSDLAFHFHISEYYLEKLFGFQMPNVPREWLLEAFHHVSVYDFLPSGNSSFSYLSEESIAIRQVFSSLTERERFILSARYGLIGGVSLTLEEIGERFGVSRERIRQLEKKALGALTRRYRRAKTRGVKINNSSEADGFEASLQFPKEFFEKSSDKKKKHKNGLKKSGSGILPSFAPNAKSEKKQPASQSIRAINDLTPYVSKVESEKIIQSDHSMANLGDYTSFIIVDYLKQENGPRTLDDILAANPRLRGLQRSTLSHILIDLCEAGFISRLYDADRNKHALVMCYMYNHPKE